MTVKPVTLSPALRRCEFRRTNTVKLSARAGNSRFGRINGAVQHLTAVYRRRPMNLPRQQPVLAEMTKGACISVFNSESTNFGRKAGARTPSTTRLWVSVDKGSRRNQLVAGS